MPNVSDGRSLWLPSNTSANFPFQILKKFLFYFQTIFMQKRGWLADSIIALEIRIFLSVDDEE